VERITQIFFIVCIPTFTFSMIGVSRLYEQGAGLIGGGFPRLSIFTVQNYETLKL